MNDALQKRHKLALYKGEFISYDEISKVYQNYVIVKTRNEDLFFGYCIDIYIHGNQSSLSGVKIRIPQLNIDHDFLLNDLISIKAINMQDLLNL